MADQRGAQIMMAERVTSAHLARRALIYVRQSTVDQVANNLESQRRQYALAKRAVELGWQRATVEVIDDDLGVSGSGVARSGFDRLVAEVGLGHVGIVLAIEVSRLARNNRDWYHLLDLCALVDTLIGDGDGLYHPGVFNDRLLLGLKGTMSEVELHLIRSRLAGGLWEAARRGELRTHLPVGFVYDRDGKIAVTPDEAIRETVALVFAKFAELGSARQVTTYFVERGLTLPHQDLREGTVSWRQAAFSPIHHMLTNPVYAGVYAYGRSKIERRMDERGRLWKRQVPRPEAEWEVFIEDHHPTYISLATYRSNRQRLRANWRSPREGGAGPVREGTALLQGLVRCGRCGRKMQISYSGSTGNVRRYSCHQAHRLHATEHACQSLGGVRLDERVAEVFLTALSPASLDATLAALDETERTWLAERTHRELLVEQVRFEADRARRQFDRVEPENRLVARTLERAWEQQLTELARCEEDLARFVTDRPNAISSEERAWLEHAGADLAAVWNAPTTSHRDRKQLLRCLIHEVVVSADRERAVADLTIVWVSGTVTHLTSRLNRVGQHRRVAPTKVLDLVRRLGPHYTNEQIAFILNAKRLRTGQGNSFTGHRVGPLRARLGIPSPAPGARTFEEGSEWQDVDAAASALGVSPDTIRRWAREGFIEARQVMPAAPWRIRVSDELKHRLVPEAPAGWVRLEEAAAALGRSKQTILHWVQSGKLRSVQVVAGKRRGLRIELNERGNGLFADA